MFLKKILIFWQDNWPGDFCLGLCNADTHLDWPITTLEDPVSWEPRTEEIKIQILSSHQLIACASTINWHTLQWLFWYCYLPNALIFCIIFLWPRCTATNEGLCNRTRLPMTRLCCLLRQYKVNKQLHILEVIKYAKTI